MGAHSPAEKLLKHWLRIASVGLWAVRGGKIGEAHFRISHILLTQIEMLCVNVRRANANRVRSVLRWLGGIFV